MKYSLAFTKDHHQELFEHLFPGDGKEAVAILLCGRRKGAEAHRFSVLEIHKVPYSTCRVRRPDYVEWPTKFIVPLMEKAQKKGLAIFKIHSHPTGFVSFSRQDDISDSALFPSIYAYMDTEHPHGSASMMPDGQIIARVFLPHGGISPVNIVSVTGDDILLWPSGLESLGEIPEFAHRHAQAFGHGTFQKLRPLQIAVIGASGTGSIVIEQLARLGVGHLVIVDPDRIERRNLNRILNARERDIGRSKVEVLAEAVAQMGTETKVTAIAGDLWNRAVAEKVAECDVLFGCMDSMSGRSLLNRIATFYLQPYIDVGIRLDADGKGGVNQICGSVHYLQPGKSSLRTRGVITDERVRAELMMKFEPEQYESLLDEGYIHGVAVDRPAVLPVNMHYSALAVMEFLARIHGFRDEPNAEFAWISTSLTGNFSINKPEMGADLALQKYVSRGDCIPFLDMPYMSAAN